MKVLHAVTNELSDRDFDKLTHKLSDAIYDLDPEIEDIYEVHIDMINKDWHVEFVPKSSRTPIIKVNAYITYNDNNKEILRLNPIDIIKFPETVKLNSYEDALNSSSKLNTILDFLVELYDFEFHF